MRRRRVAVAAALLSGLRLACQTSESSSAGTAFNYSRDMPSISSTVPVARGTVVSTSDHPAFDMAALPAESSARTMVYRSVSGIDGKGTEVSGAVFLPPGTPRRRVAGSVVGYAHGTIGVTSDCGSTGDPRLFGDIDGVAAQLSQHYAVVFTDYAGLRGGSAPIADTPQAYLEPKSAAFNLIDAVRAARSVVPQLSDRWVAMGDSQGGEIAWATAEYNFSYGQGLDLLGAAAIVPALEVSDVVRHAQDGNLTRDDLSHYPYVITGLAAVDPSLRLDDYVHGPMLDQRETLISCSSQSDERKSQLQGTLTAADAKPSSSRGGRSARAQARRLRAASETHLRSRACRLRRGRRNRGAGVDGGGGQ